MRVMARSETLVDEYPQAMFPLHEILIGMDEDIAPNVRREFFEFDIPVDGEYSTFERGLAALSGLRDEPRLLVVRIDSDESMQSLRKLAGCARG